MVDDFLEQAKHLTVDGLDDRNSLIELVVHVKVLTARLNEFDCVCLCVLIDILMEEDTWVDVFLAHIVTTVDAQCLEVVGNILLDIGVVCVISSL